MFGRSLIDKPLRLRYLGSEMSANLDLRPGPDGWVMVNDPKGTSTWICFRRNESGRWAAIAVFQLGPTIDRLRNIPLHRVEVAVNASDDISAELDARLDESVAIGTAEFHKAFTGFMKPVGRLPKLRLKRPAGRLLEDSFYAEVAETYRAAAARGMKPRSAIAEAADVSLDVAGRWVHEARKRGYLPAGQQGRVTV